jgi:hypothetical protein
MKIQKNGSIANNFRELYQDNRTINEANKCHIRIQREILV